MNLSSRISNSRKIPSPKKRELGGNTVLTFSPHTHESTGSHVKRN